MDLGFIVLGLVGLAIVFAFMHVVRKMASKQKSAGRRKGTTRQEQERNVPLTEDTVTHLGHS